MSPTNKLRRTLALVLAGGSLAIGVPAALAAGGGDDAGSAGGAATAPAPGFVQDEQQPQERPDHDCPERGGDDGNGNGNGSGDEGSSSGGSTTTPAV
jgi:hypothetical protein